MIEARSATTVAALLWLRILLAVGWTRAGLENVISPEWWIGDGLLEFLARQHSAAVPFFRPVMDRGIEPTAALVAVVVMASQLWCGVAIARGRHLRPALVWACFLNVTFILSGRLTPSTFFLVLQIVLLLAAVDATTDLNASALSSRTIVAVAVSAGLAALVLPYVRTIEPGRVIRDPALTFAFVVAVVTVTLLARRFAYVPVVSYERPKVPVGSDGIV